MLDRIRHDSVGLKMPQALEALHQIVRRLEHVETGALKAIDILLSEELTLRKNVKRHATETLYRPIAARLIPPIRAYSCSCIAKTGLISQLNKRRAIHLLPESVNSL